jgi:tetratricopeptide (TPR) repeat protein
MRSCPLLVVLLAMSVHVAKGQVIIFARVGQSQSDDAIAQIAAVAAKRAAPPQVQVVISGPTAAAEAAKLVLPKDLPAKVAIDVDYAVAGKHNVHVWPATVICGRDAKEVARISGLPPSYATDLDAYLDLAAGTIDKAALDQRLSNRQVVAPSSQQAATRHVIVANALLDRGQNEQALKELEQGLQRQPGDVSLRVARAKLLVQLKQPAAALSAAEELKNAVPAWQVEVIRADALIALERWDEAKLAAEQAIALNPNPAHALYLRGVICCHHEDYKSASDAFRRAYETSQKSRQP